jgi:hypothetical protein
MHITANSTSAPHQAAAVSPRVRAAHDYSFSADEILLGAGAGDGEDAGAAGVFGDDFSGNNSSSSSSSRPACAPCCTVLVPGVQGAHVRGVRGGEAREVEARRGETERKVKYNGHWYTESQITAMEEQARVLKQEVSLSLRLASVRARTAKILDMICKCDSKNEITYVSLGAQLLECVYVYVYVCVSSVVIVVYVRVCWCVCLNV